MSRYNKNKIIKDENGVRRLDTIIHVPPSRVENDIYIQIYGAERLDLLANRFYGDQTKWWIISKANNLNPRSLYTPENVILRIPVDVENYLDTIERYNNGR
jgi:hypothetical protein